MENLASKTNFLLCWIALCLLCSTAFPGKASENLGIQFQRVQTPDPNEERYQFWVEHQVNPDSLVFYHFVWQLEGRFYEFGSNITYTFRIPEGNLEPEVKLLAHWRSSRYAGDDDDPGVTVVEIPEGSLQLMEQATVKNEAPNLAFGRLPRPGFGTTCALNLRQSNSAYYLEVVASDGMNEVDACRPWLGFEAQLPENIHFFSSLLEAFPDRLFYRVEPTEGGLDLLLPFCISDNLFEGDSVRVQVNFHEKIDDVAGPTDDPYHSIAQTAPVVDSWDPNKKVVFPERYFFPGQTLEYTIHFENEGSAMEDSVSLIDILPRELDPASLVVVRSSHAFQQEFVAAQRTFVWHFGGDNFQLAPLSSRLSGLNRGFLTYRVKTKENLPPQTVIRNRAEVIFHTGKSKLLTEYCESIYPCGSDATDPTEKEKASFEFPWELLVIIGLLLLAFRVGTTVKKRMQASAGRSANED